MADSAPRGGGWNEQASAFDRVYAVATTVSHPTSVTDIAAEAEVAETTARAHLDRLVEMAILMKHTQDGLTTYAPDPLYIRMQTLRDLLDNHDHDGLIELKADLRDRVETWRTEYDVESPERLRERAADSSSVATTREIRQAANDWTLVRYRLALVETVTENYTTYSRDS